MTGRQFCVWNLVFLCLIFSFDAAASHPEPDPLDRLSRHTTWLRLLHIPTPQGVVSEINSEEFYISRNRQATSREELEATLNAAEVATENDAESIRCRFPARYYWLSFELLKPQWRDFSQCVRLLNWLKPDTFESISLIMISGYFGNPASTFGHSLMRLNNNEYGRDSTLLDLGINFGAQIPPNENTAVYIVRGLFGGYQSGFSDRTFYEHDQTYNRIEFRDRWEYTLNLNQYQRMLLALHLWEITAKKFTYFFIKENCSYRLAELLELVTNQELTNRVDMWYAPVTLFHDLRRIRTPEGQSWFSKVEYVPSIERRLRRTLANLEPEERKAFNQVITGTTVEQVSTPTSQFQQRVYSAALDYFEYELAGLDDDDADADAVRELQESALRHRIALPPGVESRQTAEHRPAPSELDPPTAMEIGLGYTPSAKSYLSIAYGGFQHRAIGRNTFDQSALIAFDLELGINDSGGLFLESLDLIRARKANAPEYYLPGESRRSWEVGLGIEALPDACAGCVESFIEGSMGRSHRKNAWLVNLAMGARLSSKGSAFELVPQTRLSYTPHSNWSTEFNVEWLNSLSGGSVDNLLHYTLDSRWSLGRNRQLSLSVEKFSDYSGQLRFGWRW